MYSHSAAVLLLCGVLSVVFVGLRADPILNACSLTVEATNISLPYTVTGTYPSDSNNVDGCGASQFATGRWVTYSGAPGTRVRVSTCTAQIGSGLQVLRSSSQTLNYCSYLVCVKSDFTKPECKSIEFVVDDSAVFWIGLARGPNGATYSFQIEELAVGEPYSNAVDPPFGSNQLSPAAQDIDAARDMIRIVGGAIGGGITLILIGVGLYIFIQKRRRASLFRR